MWALYRYEIFVFVSKEPLIFYVHWLAHNFDVLTFQYFFGRSTVESFFSTPDAVLR